MYEAVSDTIFEIGLVSDGVADIFIPETLEVDSGGEEQTTTSDVPLSALSVPLDELSVTDFLLLAILCVQLVRLLLSLFTRKWGFPEW